MIFGENTASDKSKNNYSFHRLILMTDMKISLNLSAHN